MISNFSTSEENYLKSIYQLQLEQGTVTTTVLAEVLNTRPASVTEMMKKLNTKRLLHYKPYYGFSLNAEGKKAALLIIRRHRLWEYFLSSKLGFSWEEVHTVADELEHVSSRKLIDRLDAFLGYPPFDPHGDPIPDRQGKMNQIQKLSLDQLPLHQPAEICQVINQSEEMLDFLKEKSISLGSRVEIRKRFQFDHSVEIRLKSGMVTLSQELARNLFVKKIKHATD